MVGHHYVLPIAKEHRGEIQGSVHRTSASNETVFIEPQAIAEQSAQLSFLRAREAKEIRRILRWLSAQVGQVADSLLGTPGNAGRARPDLRAGPLQPRLPDVAPRLQSGREARAPRGPAPASRSTLPGEPAIPAPGAEEALPEPDADPAQRPMPPMPLPPPHRPSRGPWCRSTCTSGFGFTILVVTGPNTGGKTVALEDGRPAGGHGAVGPAHPGARGLAASRSSTTCSPTSATSRAWSSRSRPSRRTSAASREILGKATERSLVLLDEMGAGTDPAEGAALGRAILDELDSLGCRSIVTTHIGDLKTYAFSNPGPRTPRSSSTSRRSSRGTGSTSATSASRMRCRSPGGSNLPEHLIARARRYLRTGAGESTSPSWRSSRSCARTPRRRARRRSHAQAEAERSREALHQRLADLQHQAEQDARSGRGPRPAPARRPRGRPAASATTVPAGSSSSIRARRRPSSRSARCSGTSRSTS